MHAGEPLTRAAITRARIDRVIARLPELSEERLDGIEANLFELADLAARCTLCTGIYRPYLERCPTCARRR